MVVPYDHQASLAALPPETTHEMMDLAQRSERALAGLYHPDGFNFGLNLGKSAGAGVPDTSTCTPCRAGPAIRIYDDRRRNADPPGGFFVTWQRVREALGNLDQLPL